MLPPIEISPKLTETWFLLAKLFTVIDETGLDRRSVTTTRPNLAQMASIRSEDQPEPLIDFRAKYRMRMRKWKYVPQRQCFMWVFLWQETGSTLHVYVPWNISHILNWINGVYHCQHNHNSQRRNGKKTVESCTLWHYFEIWHGVRVYDGDHKNHWLQVGKSLWWPVAAKFKMAATDIIIFQISGLNNHTLKCNTSFYRFSGLVSPFLMSI